MLSGCQPLLCNFLFNCTNRPSEEGMMGQKASRPPDFLGLEKKKKLGRLHNKLHGHTRTQDCMLYLLVGLSGRLWNRLRPSGCVGLMQHMLTFFYRSTIKLEGSRIHQQHRRLSTPPLFIGACAASTHPFTLFSCET